MSHLNIGSGESLRNRSCSDAGSHRNGDGDKAPKKGLWEKVLKPPHTVEKDVTCFSFRTGEGGLFCPRLGTERPLKTEPSATQPHWVEKTSWLLFRTSLLALISLASAWFELGASMIFLLILSDWGGTSPITGLLLELLGTHKY